MSSVCNKTLAEILALVGSPSQPIQVAVVAGVWERLCGTYTASLPTEKEGLLEFIGDCFSDDTWSASEMTPEEVFDRLMAHGCIFRVPGGSVSYRFQVQFWVPQLEVQRQPSQYAFRGLVEEIWDAIMQLDEDVRPQTKTNVLRLLEGAVPPGAWEEVGTDPEKVFDELVRRRRLVLYNDGRHLRYQTSEEEEPVKPKPKKEEEPVKPKAKKEEDAPAPVTSSTTSGQLARVTGEAGIPTAWELANSEKPIAGLIQEAMERDVVAYLKNIHPQGRPQSKQTLFALFTNLFAPIVWQRGNTRPEHLYTRLDSAGHVFAILDGIHYIGALHPDRSGPNPAGAPGYAPPDSSWSDFGHFS